MPAKGKKRQCNQAQFQNRVAVAVQLLTRGLSTHEIVTAMSKQYSVTPRQVHNYIARAKEQITASFDEIDLKDFAALTLARLNLVVKSGFKQENLGAVVNAIQAQMRLTGTDGRSHR